MESQRRDQAQHALRDPHGDRDEIGVAEWLERSEAVQPAGERRDHACVAHRIQALAAHAEAQSLGHAHRPAVPTEQLDLAGKGRNSRLRHGDIMHSHRSK
jgi:hypothetical protein